MPPKKAEEEEIVLLGRVGTNLRCGIVGLPNVGKSTFFNVLTKSSAAAENFPFCTIEPNEARCPVPDERFDWLCAHHKPASKVPAYLQITDIAGLVKGAAEGQGLGNAFLSHIKAVDGIFHMLRTFEDEDVTHVEGDVNPIRDLEIIHEELRLKDQEFLDKHLDFLTRTTRQSNDKAKKEELAMCQTVHDWVVRDKKEIRFGTWNSKEIEFLNDLTLITAKPVIYLVNLSEEDFIRKKNKWLPKIIEFVQSRDKRSVVIPLSGAFESKLLNMTEQEAAEYQEKTKCTSSLPKIIRAGFKALQLEYFFTAGTDEVRAWTIKRGTKAPQSAGRIHTDMEHGFIMAEVMRFDDYKEAGSENAVKAAGKYLMKGRDYVVGDGDIIFFKFNRPTGDKKK
ncbi:GTP-binding protein [Capsaspora owczarzaki ATCC 30864]|uniref:Obg-like ATPase 1 n=1 Tax=Capsaspora owczarzaki (strain ATCC 30864) TaxID=595528 RepID=A0A0D2X3A7_CAPO3|nr:GTP-binding protein [Capsaspora owczarzaki ATCC 30864]KJE93979.1 GTP-binding protein [Capsaspora owczarzaki ATCC 30864]|eukprot:XP_004347436.1 GTP-binding protein [Capsaspora owczarzaki ATCC 30864]